MRLFTIIEDRTAVGAFCCLRRSLKDVRMKVGKTCCDVVSFSLSWCNRLSAQQDWGESYLGCA